MFQKISITNKFCSFEFECFERILEKKNWNMNVDSLKISAYYYDFWRSCDTEDWSYDAENTALITEINYILKHIQINKLF